MAVKSQPAYRVETERLVLRCWSPSDAVVLRKTLDHSDAHLRPWIPFMKDEPRSLEETSDWLASIRAMFDRREHYRYAVFDHGEKNLVGENMLLDRVGPGALEIGYLTHLGFTGTGFASEATRAVIRLGFEVHGADRLEIHCAPENRASAAIPGKLGFTLEATLRRRITDTEGAVQDLMIWSMLREEYAATGISDTPLMAWDALGRQIL